MIKDYLTTRLQTLKDQQAGIVVQIQQGDVNRATLINQGNVLEGAIQELLAAITELETEATATEAPASAETAPTENPDSTATVNA